MSLASDSRRTLFACAGLALLAGLGACSPPKAEQDKAAADPAKGVVNVYSARHYDSDIALFDAFTRQTGIEVRTVESRAELLAERLKAEGQNSPADVVVTVDGGNLWRLAQAGVIVPSQARPDAPWVTMSLRARVIAYAPARVKAAELTHYADLADPKFKGRVCVRSSTNVYNLSLVASLIARDGEPAVRDWAKGVVANMARDPQGGDIEQLKAIAAGVCDVALVNHYYFVRLQRSDLAEERALVEGIALSFPDQDKGGTHVNISGAALAAHAPNAANAQALLAFLNGPQAQGMIADLNNEFPADPASPIANPQLDALKDFVRAPVAAQAMGAGQADAQRLLDEAGWK